MTPNAEPKVTRLPEQGDMLARLRKVHDDSHAVEGFYPLILKSANKELNGPGVVLMLELAIHDYTEGMPSFMFSVIQLSIRSFVVALIDDPEVEADALTMLDQVEAKMAADN